MSLTIYIYIWFSWIYKFKEKKNNTFVTSVYRKAMFSGVYPNFESFIPFSYKVGLLSTFIYRCSTICSNMSKFHLELERLKDIFRKNGYPASFIDKCIKKFLDKLYTPKRSVATVSKKELLLVFPYLRKLSLQTRIHLSKLFRDCLPFCKVNFVLKPL